MDKISTLAKSFRKNASGEAQRISSDLESGLKRLESDTATALESSRQSLLAALKGNEKAMSEAIQRQRKAQLWAYRWPVVLLITLCLALTAFSGWQGVKLREQAQAIEQAKRTLASLPVGWRVAQIEGKSYLQTDSGKPQLLEHRTDKKTWFIPLAAE
jgi:hypothetical protein